MQKIILNADDFGKSPGRNKAIHDSFVQGLISSAGLIVTGKHWPEAIALMNEGGYVENVHLHVNLSANLLHEDSDDAPLSERMRKDAFFCSDGKFKPYKGLPKRIATVAKWRVVYKELEAQYERFRELTKGKGDLAHIDFHLWYNLSWPVAIALNLFIRKYKIKSVRFIGEHQKGKRRFRVLAAISRNPSVRCIPATNIDYYLSKKPLKEYDIIELYCHPHYKDGVFLDDSPSYLKHERRPMFNQIQDVKRLGSIQIISWKDIKYE